MNSEYYDGLRFLNQVDLNTNLLVQYLELNWTVTRTELINLVYNDDVAIGSVNALTTYTK